MAVFGNFCKTPFFDKYIIFSFLPMRKLGYNDGTKMKLTPIIKYPKNFQIISSFFP